MNDLNIGGMAIAPNVVETIVALAAQDVEGVAAVGTPGASTSLRSMLPGKPSIQGVEVSVNDNEKLVVSVHVDVLYGYALPDVAAKIRESVADAVLLQVGAPVESVDVYVDGIQFEN